MSINFKTYSDSWIKAVNHKDTNSMSDVYQMTLSGLMID